MADHRHTGAAQDREKTQDEPKPIPRDMPGQQRHDGPDPLDAPAHEDDRPDDELPDEGVPDEDLPDTDETGTGKRGRPLAGGVHPGQPVPDEPSA